MSKILISLFFLTALSACLWKSQPKVKPGGQVIANGAEITVEADKDSVSFVPAEIWASPGEKIRLKVANELIGKDINFLVLQEGEDPIVVANLALQESQNGKEWKPDHYSLVGLNKIEPRAVAKLSFELPKKEGVYYFVSTYPGQAEGLQGKIVVKKNLEDEKEEESLELISADSN